MCSAVSGHQREHQLLYSSHDSCTDMCSLSLPLLFSLSLSLFPSPPGSQHCATPFREEEEIPGHAIPQEATTVEKDLAPVRPQLPRGHSLSWHSLHQWFPVPNLISHCQRGGLLWNVWEPLFYTLQYPPQFHCFSSSYLEDSVFTIYATLYAWCILYAIVLNIVNSIY